MLLLLMFVFYRIEIIRNRLTVILKIIFFKNFFVVIVDLARFFCLDCADLLPRCCCVFSLSAIIKIINLQYRSFSPNYLIRRLYLPCYWKIPGSLLACSCIFFGEVQHWDLIRQPNWLHLPLPCLAYLIKYKCWLSLWEHLSHWGQALSPARAHSHHWQYLHWQYLTVHILISGSYQYLPQ